MMPAARDGVIPVIDIGPFLCAPATPATHPPAIAAAKALGAAFERTGFAVIVNHGIPPSLGERTYGLAERFHNLPAELKERVKNYVPHGHENVSQLIGNMNKPNDISDRLRVDNYRGDAARGAAVMGSNPGNPAETAAHDARQLEFTADQLVPGLQDAAQGYFDAVAGVWWQLNRMSAVALDLPVDFFEPFYPAREHWSFGSLRCYPTLVSEDELQEGQLRFGECG
jgi:isopenicillin N synthase-like dioxygenase